MIESPDKIYSEYMKKCIELARKGEGKVSPNPLVGAVVLDKNGNLAGYGWHKRYGDRHAEPNAIAMAEENGIDIQGGTVIVSLEPCSHYGKTPPCADLIIKKGLKKVVIGCVDPNPKVSGNGIEKLKKAGIEVILNVMEKECKSLNEIFIKNQLEKKIFVAIKTATTMDGKIATKTGSSKWITSEKAREKVQELRNKYDAVLTGSQTVKKDNPSLTCRMEEGRNPVRIIIDSAGICPSDSKVFDDNLSKVYWVIAENTVLKQCKKNVEILRCPVDKNSGKIDLKFLLDKLYEKGIRSILVEAGGILNGVLLSNGLVDKLYQFIAPKILGDVNAKSFIEGFDLEEISDCQNLQIQKLETIGADIFIEADFIK